MTIKALPTRYREITYRSRTEARWAVFLDELRVPFSYEAEGFDLGGDWYLPDFWLPKPGVWFEVKGVEPNDRELRVAKALSQASRCPVLIAVGAPSVRGEFGLLAFRDGQQIENVAFAGDGEDVFIASESQWVMMPIRGSASNLHGAPQPFTGPAKVAAAERFGIH